MSRKSSSQMQALEVEVVGGLVHEQQIGLLQQQPREGHAHAPAPGELGDGPVEVVVLEAHAAQDGLRPGLELVAVDALEGGLQGAHLVQQRLGVGARPVAAPVDRPRAAPRRRRRCVGLADLMAQLDDAPLGRQDLGVRGQHLVDDRVIGDLLDLLGEKADAQVLAGADLAAVERHLPHDEAEQGGLAGAVGPDQPDAHARLDVQAGLVEQHLAAERFGDVGDVEHQAR